jgi:hypothetical protein
MPESLANARSRMRPPAGGAVASAMLVCSVVWEAWRLVSPRVLMYFNGHGKECWIGKGSSRATAGML